MNQTISDLQPIDYQPIHNEQLKLWYGQWNVPDVIDLLPETGFIIPGMCAIFLYLTNSKVSFLDGFICNKDIPKEIRNICLDKVVKATCQLSDDKGYKLMSATTNLPAVIERSIKFGFVPAGQYEMLLRSKS